MKTTIEISDDLMKQVKELAAKRNSTLRAVIEKGIRAALKEEQRAKKFQLPDRSVDGRGLQPDFAHRSWSDIRDAAYEGRGA